MTRRALPGGSSSRGAACPDARVSLIKAGAATVLTVHLLLGSGCCTLTIGDADGGSGVPSATSGGTSSGTTGGGSSGGTGGGGTGPCPAIDAGSLCQPDSGAPIPSVCSCDDTGSCSLQMVFHGCGGDPEFSRWDSLSYAASLPAGTDIELLVQVTNSLDAGVLADLPSTVVCSSLQTACCGDPIELAQPLSYSESGAYGTYLVVTARGHCGPDGGSGMGPQLECMSSAMACPDN